MARPERNTVDYFPHILGEGKKMFFIEHKYGNDGYATWYKILEKLGSTENHYLNLNKEEEVMYLAAKCRVTEEVLLTIISDLAKMGVFNKDLWDSKVIWCQQFIDSVEDAYKKRNNKCITLEGLRILLEGLRILKPNKSTLKGSGNTQRIEEDSKVKEIKEEDSIILYLNQVTNSSFKSDSKNSIKHISARLKEKFVLQDFYDVIDHKFYSWGADPKMKEYLRPETLFGNKFESYLQAAKAQPIKVLNTLEITALNIQKAKENLGL